MARPTLLIEAALSVCRNYLEARYLVGLDSVEGELERWRMVDSAQVFEDARSWLSIGC